MFIGEKKIGKDIFYLLKFLIEFGISTKQLDDKYLKIAFSKIMI
jgi:hypothetical protein